MAIAEHRDQDFKNDGSFDQIKNSQIQDTATAVASNVPAHVFVMEIVPKI